MTKNGYHPGNIESHHNIYILADGAQSFVNEFEIKGDTQIIPRFLVRDQFFTPPIAALKVISTFYHRFQI